MKKVELIKEESIELKGSVLYRIRALKDFINQGALIKAGTVGGYVESLDNIGDSAWVADEARVYGQAQVCKNC